MITLAAWAVSSLFSVQDEEDARNRLDVLHRTITVDGATSDWMDIKSIVLVPGGMNTSRHGDFDGADDLLVTLRLAWDREHLYGMFEWHDDVVDSKHITRDEAMWLDVQGRRLDRMYFHDGLSLLLTSEDFSYRVWFSPLPGEEGKSSFQWDRLRPAWRRFDRDRPDVFPDAPESSFSRSTDADGRSTVLVELKIPWEKLKRTPREDEVFELILTVPDADEPSHDTAQRSEHVAYMSWQGEVKLSR